MKIGGPIVLVDDDNDDQELYKEAFISLDIDVSLIRAFSNGPDALTYLETTQEKPLIIFCDVNLPILNGVDFRRKINENDELRRKSIPFVFMSTTAQPKHIAEAYDLTVQGFFVKPIQFKSIKHIFELIFEYWTECIHPNSVKK